MQITMVGGSWKKVVYPNVYLEHLSMHLVDDLAQLEKPGHKGEAGFLVLPYETLHCRAFLR